MHWTIFFFFFWVFGSHLEMLVEATHVVLRLLEDLVKSEGVLRVRRTHHAILY